MVQRHQQAFSDLRNTADQAGSQGRFDGAGQVRVVSGGSKAAYIGAQDDTGHIADEVAHRNAELILGDYIRVVRRPSQVNYGSRAPI